MTRARVPRPLPARTRDAAGAGPWPPSLHRVRGCRGRRGRKAGPVRVPWAGRETAGRGRPGYGQPATRRQGYARPGAEDARRTENLRNFPLLPRFLSASSSPVNASPGIYGLFTGFSVPGCESGISCPTYPVGSLSRPHFFPHFSRKLPWPTPERTDGLGTPTETTHLPGNPWSVPSLPPRSTQPRSITLRPEGPRGTGLRRHPAHSEGWSSSNLTPTPTCATPVPASERSERPPELVAMKALVDDLQVQDPDRSRVRNFGVQDVCVCCCTSSSRNHDPLPPPLDSLTKKGRPVLLINECQLSVLHGRVGGEGSRRPVPVHTGVNVSRTETVGTCVCGSWGRDHGGAGGSLVCGPRVHGTERGV